MELQHPLATITPTLDGEVLAVLAQPDAVFTTGQLQRVLPGYSVEGIRKVLQRLAQQGVVSSDRVGNAFSYRLNRDHLAAACIAELANLMDKLLRNIKEHLSGWRYPPVYAAIFGSAARGTMTSGSDLDLFLVRADDVPLSVWEVQLSTLAADVTRWTGNDTRPLDYAVSELNGARGEPVVQAVLKEGLTVAGNRTWLSREVRKGEA